MRDQSENNERLKDRNPYDERIGIVNEACNVLEQSVATVISELDKAKAQSTSTEAPLESLLLTVVTVPESGYDQPSAFTTPTNDPEIDSIAAARQKIEDAFKRAA
ncbi:hypothetical protein M1512_03670 [Patescibacteria group bacterium]|nr:hypothetical protein [Patescibacteria group bacterium]